MLRTSKFKFALRTIALGALLLAVLMTVNPAGTARAQLPPDIMVRNDGKTFQVVESNKLFSASHSVAPEANQLVNANLAERNLKPFGNPSPESVIGPDGRTQVTNTGTYPNSAIAHLEIDFPSASGTCTGWFIGPARVATAAHCVYDGSVGGFANTILVIPGRSGATAPFGSFNGASWSVSGGWITYGTPKYDYAVIDLNSNVGNTVGYFGYMWTKDDSFYQGRKVTVRGYPGDKAYGTMWTMNGKIQTVQKKRLFYSIDTFGGQSGSPIYGNNINGCGTCGFGIHAYGTNPPNVTKNSGARITKSIFNFFSTP